MDDLFIQEEVVVKTEPIEDHNFEVNLSERFIIDSPNNEDLMAYLNHTNSKDKNFIKKETFGDVVSTNLFENGNHFMDPDTMIAHYEEVVQDLNTSVGDEDNLVKNCDPLFPESRMKKCGRKRKNSRSYNKSPRTKSKLDGKFGDSLSIESDAISSRLNYECTLCVFMASTEIELKHHMLDHIGGPDTDTFIEESYNGDSYACIFCHFSSVSEDVFRDHLKFKHVKPSKSLRKNSTMEFPLFMGNNLLDEISGRDAFFCKFCRRTENSEFAIQQHLIKYHSDKIFKCTNCNFIGFNKTSFKKHNCLPTETKMYSCTLCSFNTKSLSTLVKHENAHMENKIYSCDECPFKGKTRDGLRQHKKLHSGDMQFSCSFCSYKAGKKSRIIRHERIHTGERPYVCPHCNFSCNQGSTLKIHIRRHTGEKPYECTICSYRTVSKCSLNAHVKKHDASSEFNVVCQICNQIYNNTTALSKHELTHTKEHSEGFVKNIKNKKRKSDQLVDSIQIKSTDKRMSKRRRNEIKTQSNDVFVKESEPNISSLLNKFYRCTLCPFRCTLFSELSSHMSEHTSNVDGRDPQSLPKKYRCTPCNIFFSKMKDVMKHRKEKHEAQNKTTNAYFEEDDEEIEI